MRLVIATPLYPPEPGGPATYSKLLEDGLPERGVSVTLIKFSEVRHLPKVVRHLAYFWRVLSASFTADLILALDPVSVGLPARLAAYLARKPFVVKVVGDYAWEQGRQRFRIWLPLDEFVRTADLPLQVLGLRAIQSFVARTARQVIVPSEYLKRIVSIWGVPEDRVAVIANAKPIEHAGTLPEALADAGRPRIVMIGRLVPWKGIHGLLSALPLIRERIPTAEVIIVGEGPERSALERYASSRLRDGYRFLGALPHPEALAVLADADVFVLNSTYEGLSHILIEALEFGKAVVATRAGGNGEVISHGENGLLIPVGDTDALADACVSILEDAHGRATLELAAKASADRFAPERMFDATATLLSSLV